MNKYLNIHTAPDGTVTIFLYGEIGDYGDVKSGNVVSELKAAENSGARIDVRINSIGGDVYSGIALYNALKGSRADIHIYIDGVAASMAAVLALCGKPVTMSKYARLMLHSVSGGCYGNKTELRRCIDEIQALEDSLADMLASKLKTDKAQIKSSYFDDNDHWLTAGEALSLGLVDGIYDADPVPDDSTPEQIYSIFNNRLDKPSNDNQMNLEELKSIRASRIARMTPRFSGRLTPLRRRQARFPDWKTRTGNSRRRSKALRTRRPRQRKRSVLPFSTRPSRTAVSTPGRAPHSRTY